MDIDVYRRYFRVTNTALLDAMVAQHEKNQLLKRKLGDMAQEYGFNDAYFRGVDFLGFGLKSEGQQVEDLFDESLFRVHKTLTKELPRGEFMVVPSNRKAGKELKAKIKELDQAVSVWHIAFDMLDKLFDWRSHHWVIECFPKMYGVSGTLKFDKDDKPHLFIQVPWYDEDPAKLEDARLKKECGEVLDVNERTLLTEFPADTWQELKQWEYIKQCEEIDAGNTDEKAKQA